VNVHWTFTITPSHLPEGAGKDFFSNLLGVTAHGIGTARAFQESEQAGAFSGLAMGLNTLVTALLLPLRAHLISFG